MNPNLIPLYKFWVQTVTGILVLVFCGFGITSGDKRNIALYSNLGFLALGYLLPSPGTQNRRQEEIYYAETNVLVDKNNNNDAT